MNLNQKPSQDTSHMDRALDVAIRLAFVGFIVLWCSRIIKPFFMPLLWGVVISVALYPVFLKLKGWLGGRNNLAGVIFIVVSLALVITPTALLTESLIDRSLRRACASSGLAPSRTSPLGDMDLPTHRSQSTIETMESVRTDRPGHRSPTALVASALRRTTW